MIFLTNCLVTLLYVVSFNMYQVHLPNEGLIKTHLILTIGVIIIKKMIIIILLLF